MPSAQTEAEVAKQADVLADAGPEGQAVLHDIDVFVTGINDYRASQGSSITPWARNDVFALNALKGQFVGQGGGDEARRSEFLSGLEQRLGAKKGLKVFNDLRQFKNRELPTSVDGRFPYGSIPDNPKGSVILDHDSYTPTPAVANPKLARTAPRRPTHASNTLMITGDHSKTGNPLMVGGPQIGYFYPGLTYEIDMHAGDLQWRGATSAPFPGYVLIGRGEDFAHTLTSASGDIIDQFVEKLCNGSDTMYLYKGQCLEMGIVRRRHARRPAGLVPHHRPRPGRRLRDGQRREGRDLVASAPPTARTRSTCSTTAGSPTVRSTARSRSSRRPR